MLRKLARQLPSPIKTSLRSLHAAVSIPRAVYRSVAGSRRPPKVVATLVVRDEIDIVGYNIEHCLAIGVDHVIVTDHLSTDGTTDLLREYERSGAITLIREQDPGFHQGVWVTGMARLAATRLGATWVLNLDADEFPWPGHGTNQDLTDLLGRTLRTVPLLHGCIKLRREDMRPGAAEADHWLNLNTLRDLDTRSWRTGGRLRQKLMHRADEKVVVPDGNHSVRGPSISPLGRWSGGMVLLHFPDRGYAHYERKIRNGGSALLHGQLFHIGTHWHDDYRRLLEGTLRPAYESRLISPAQLDELLALGRVVPEQAFKAHMLSLREASAILRRFGC